MFPDASTPGDSAEGGSFVGSTLISSAASSAAAADGAVDEDAAALSACSSSLESACSNVSLAAAGGADSSVMDSASSESSTPASATSVSDGCDFPHLFECWKTATCCLHSLSRVACYPSAAAVLPAELFTTKNAQQTPHLSPHFAEAATTEYPKAKAVLSYRAFKQAGYLCPPVFSSCFTPSVFCEFLRDAHGDISTQSAARHLLNSIFIVHLREKVQPYLNEKDEFTIEALSDMFLGLSFDAGFPTLNTLKEENDAAHPGLLNFFAKYLAVRLFFALDVGRRGFIKAKDLLHFEEFQQLLNSLSKPLGSPLGDTPAQWSVQFAYDIFNFLREKRYVCCLKVVEELMEALRAVVCPYTFDCTLKILQNLFLTQTVLQLKHTDLNSVEGPLWVEWKQPGSSAEREGVQQQQQLRQQDDADFILSLATEDLIRFLAALDYCAAVWNPNPTNTRIVAPSCVSASLHFLWSILDVEQKGFLSLQEVTDFTDAVCASLTSRGYPAGCLLRGSLESEIFDRLQIRKSSIDRKKCVSSQTQGRFVLMMLLSPAFFQLFEQREHCPGAPLLPGDPVSLSAPNF